MNSRVATIIDTLQHASTQAAGQGLASIAGIVHQALAQREAGGVHKRGDLNRWLIVLAAVAGAFFVMRAMRKLVGLAFGLVWIWLFVGGHVRHLHFW